MKEALEKLVRHSAVFLVGLLFQRAARFLLLPLYWSAFPPAQFGLLDLFEVFIQVMVLTFSFALPTAYLKFRRVDVGENVTPAQLRGTTLVLTLGGLVCFGLVTALFQTPLSWLFFKGRHPRLYTIAVSAIGANIVFLMIQGVLRAHGRAAMFVILSSVQFLVLMVFNVYFVAFRGMGIRGVLLSSLLAWGAPSLLFVAFRGPQLSWRFDRDVARRLIRFVVPLVPFSLLTYATMISGRLFLQHYHTAHDVGILSSANRVALILMLVCVTPFQTSWGYLGLDFLRRDDARELFSRAFTYLLAWGLWTFLAVAFIARAMILFFGKKHYIPALPYIDALMAGYLMLLFFYWSNVVLMRRDMTGRILLLALPSVAVAILGGWAVIPRAGIGGACAVFAVAMAAQAGFTVLYSWRIAPFRLEWERVLKILVGFAVVYGGGRFAGTKFPEGDLWIVLAEIAAFPILLGLSRCLTPGEIAWIRDLPRSIGQSFGRRI